MRLVKTTEIWNDSPRTLIGHRRDTPRNMGSSKNPVWTDTHSTAPLHALNVVQSRVQVRKSNISFAYRRPFRASARIRLGIEALTTLRDTGAVCCSVQLKPLSLTLDVVANFIHRKQFVPRVIPFTKYKECALWSRDLMSPTCPPAASLR